ncbi:plasmid recombination protein [Bacteroides thetaiotaomicron]|nr:plasmid recombination protein [Bacteroides thetaiotaomicron]MCS2487389.1 plasmid recombination protein [Bacteroides thetaiotaomicron]
MTAIGENPERLTQWMNENYRFVSERFGEKRSDTAHSLCRCAVNQGWQTFRQRGHGRQA